MIGLSIGLTAFAIILYYYNYQKSFDQFHPQGDQIYRTVMTRLINNEWVSERPDTYPALAPVLNDQIPEIEIAQVIMYGGNSGTLMDFSDDPLDQDALIDDLKVLHADPQFFDMIRLELISGDVKGLEAPFTGLISSSSALRLFGTTDVIGKTWSEDEGDQYQIIGVFKKWENNTHLEFDLIKSYESIGARHGIDFHRTSWDWDRMKVYVKLKDGVSVKTVNEKIRDIISLNKPIKDGLILEEFLQLQPIQDIHLRSDFEARSFLASEYNRVKGLLLIGIIILAIAWVNFLNFQFAISLEKLRSVGIQKSFGAGFGYFLKRQIVESFIINGIALLLAISLWQIFKPFIDIFAGVPNSFAPDISFYVNLVAISFIGLILSLQVPFAIFRRVEIPNALKGKLLNTPQSALLIRKPLLSFQWSVSICLIIAIFIIHDQMDHLDSIDRGVNIQNILVVKGPRVFDYERFSENPDFIKNRLLELAGISAVASSYDVPGGYTICL